MKKIFFITIMAFSSAIIIEAQEIIISHDPAGNREVRVCPDGMTEKDDDLVTGSVRTGELSDLSTNETSLGLEFLEGELSLELYPNPVNDYIIFDVNSESVDYGNIQIEVFNSIGKLMLSKQVSKNNSQLDVSKLASGNYILKARLNDELQKWQFIKQ